MSDIQDAKYRDAEIERANRDKKVAKMFFDERQRLLFPFANQISQLMTNEILSLKDPTGDTEESIKAQFSGNLTALLGGNKVVANSIIKQLEDANFDAISFSFINASWQEEIKGQLMLKFKSGNTNEKAIVLYFKKYVQTYDSNHDGIRDAGLKSEPTTDAPSVPPRPVAIGYSVLQQEILDVLENNNTYPSLLEDLWRQLKIDRIIGSTITRPALLATLKKVGGYKSKHIEIKQVLDDLIATRRNKGLALGNGFKQQKKRMSFVGRGLTLSDSINSKLFVDMTHLNNNKLAVKYKSTKKLCEKPKDITDAQKESIISIIHHQYTEKEYNRLRSEEKELIKDFVIKAQAKDVDFITEKDTLRMKFDVLIGEIEAGNDNTEIRKMLKETTTRLMKTKGITKLEGLSILSQL